VTFELYSRRFTFRTQGPIHFAAGKPGNILRSALGNAFRKTTCSAECLGECANPETCQYARLFEPSAIGKGPSGYSDRPRPFVFRIAHLDGKTFGANERFWFDVNLFIVQNPPIEQFTKAFEQLSREGVGPGRTRLQLLSVEPVGQDGSIAELERAHHPITLSLAAQSEGVRHVRVEFVTPTELKGAREPGFGVLFARIRDRVSALRTFYGRGPLSIDFREARERAAAVRIVGADLRHIRASRRSSASGATHDLGGYTGIAEYEGELGEFIPYLEAARWTGVGRHCVWGNGEMRLLPEASAHQRPALDR